MFEEQCFYEKESIKEFYKRLENHDWYFEYSDDHSVWMKGNREYKDLTRYVSENGGIFLEMMNAFTDYYTEKREKPTLSEFLTEN